MWDVGPRPCYSVLILYSKFPCCESFLIAFFPRHFPACRISDPSDPSVLTCSSNKAGKAVPLQAWTGTEGSTRFRLPDFKTIDTCRRQVCQPYAPATFTPRKYSWNSFLLILDHTFRFSTGRHVTIIAGQTSGTQESIRVSTQPGRLAGWLPGSSRIYTILCRVAGR
jgi:hypothetical protein